MTSVLPNQSRGLARLPVELTPQEARVEQELFEALQTVDPAVTNPGAVYPFLLRQIDAQAQAGDVAELLTIGK